MFVAYYRVSTDKQGQSGLGLEAQQEAVRGFLGAEPGLEFVEVESGAKKDRPELLRALAHANKTGSTLIVAKLDRLARDVKLILSIVDSGVSVRFVDLPELDTSSPTGRLMLTMMASFAEFERRIISKRTREALGAKRARGCKLGSSDTSKATEASVRARADKIKSFDSSVMPIILSLQSKGYLTSRAIADQLTLAGVPTAKNKHRWGHGQVCEILRRAA
jgi:DNA invertase Pin-like site-specific DNA recombinase